MICKLYGHVVSWKLSMLVSSKEISKAIEHVIKVFGELANCQTGKWSNIFGNRPNVKCWIEVSMEVDFHWIEIHGVFMNLMRYV